MATLILRQVWSDLAHNKAHTLLAVLSIAAGVFAVGLAFGALGVMRACINKTRRVFSAMQLATRRSELHQFPLLGHPGYTLVGNRVGAFGVGQFVAGA